MKKIYILHEYGDESHFKALYKCAYQYGFEVSPQIILQNKSIIKKFIIDILKYKKIKAAIKQLFQNLEDRKKINSLNGQIIIAGIAPYNKILNRYKKAFQNNYSYYFTSWTCWDGSSFPKGTISNKCEFEQTLKKCFNGAFCVTKNTESQIKSIISRTAIVGHSIECCLYKKKDIFKNKKKRFVFLGRYVHRKNIGLILQWLKNNPDADIEIDFIGSGELKKDIDTCKRSDKRINERGMFSKEKIQSELCTYDYLILPSEKEPFGIVLIEALASGVPCIVSNADGPAEIIDNEKNGFIFDLRDREKSFDEVMKKSIFLNEEKYQNMSKAAIDKSKFYDVNNIIKKWMSLLVEDGKCEY